MIEFLTDEQQKRLVIVEEELVTIQDQTSKDDVIVIERDYDLENKSATYVRQ